MLKLTNPRLRRSNVVLNSFGSCISNTPKEFSWTPEMSFSEIIPQPRMFLQKLEGTISFKQLQGFADTHRRWHLNKQVDMVYSDVQLINFESMPVCDLPNKKLTIHSNSIKFHGVSSILTLPHEVESILPEGMFKTLQIHSVSPQNIAHAKSEILVHEPSNQARDIQAIKELNFIGGRIPPMFENMGTLRQM